MFDKDLNTSPILEQLQRSLFLQKLPLVKVFKNSFPENFGKLPRENPLQSLFFKSCRLKVSRIAFHGYIYEDINFSAFLSGKDLAWKAFYDFILNRYLFSLQLVLRLGHPTFQKINFFQCQSSQALNFERIKRADILQNILKDYSCFNECEINLLNQISPSHAN